MELEIRSLVALFITSSCVLQTVDGNDADFGVNIAYGKPANQSSTYLGDPWYGEPNGFLYIASLAVDGNTNTIFHNGSCSHTAVYESNAWWEVYLQGLYDVSLIKIYQRTDANENGMNGFAVQGVNSDNSYVTVDQSDPYHAGVITISLQPRREFKAIKILLNRQDAFICLCEVEVFAIIKCPIPLIIPEDSDASYIPGIWGTSTYNSSVKIRCREGYRLQSTEEIRCTVNGTWSDTHFGTCSAITCPIPHMIPENSILNFIPGIAGNLTYNSSVNIKCHEGYKLQGQEVAAIRCTINGTWSEKSFGICFDVDECAYGDNVCNNSGHCINTQGSYKCRCYEGFAGQNCEKDRQHTLSLKDGDSGDCDCHGQIILPIAILIPLCVILTVTNAITCLRLRRYAETKKDRLKIVAPDFNAFSQRTEPYEELQMNTRGQSEYDTVKVQREPYLEARKIEHLYHKTEPHTRVEMKNRLTPIPTNRL